MRSAFAGLILVTLLFPASAGEKIDPDLLVGTWELQPKGKEKLAGGLTIKYTADGKMTGEIYVGKESLKVEGTYTVVGDQIRLRIKDGGQDVESVVTVSRLTATEMVASDDGRPSETFRKSSAKK
ncbi:MAG TPA: lipocalin family protein [Gemmataceae bacterium]|jgi:uncharacterized protein (TIGR03066 family)|nr:lipocalin family protein [Gemmataceae bacterium]